MAKNDLLNFRENVLADDGSAVRDIVASSGFFYDHEVAVAVELVEERLEKGEKSGYFFLFAERDGRVIGYCCYGPIACTEGSYDLYWIAVHDDCRGQGIGKVLMKKCEELIAARGGRGIWVETSGQEKYQPTRDFYIHNQYHLEAVLTDFYGPGDDKFVFVKRVP